MRVREELTSGTAWHAEAQCPAFAFNQLLVLGDHPISLYHELAGDPANPISDHYVTGGLRLLTVPDNAIPKGIN